MLDDLLLQHLNAAPSKCSFGKWFEEQPEKSQELFTQVLQKKNINIAALYETLTQLGELPFKATTFKSHLRGVCKCPKP